MVNESNWSAEQHEAVVEVEQWLANPNAPQIFRLFGYAGVGKTTIANYLARSRRTAFAAFTGKAASVMRKSGCKTATTIDKLIYLPKIEYSCIKVGCEPPCIIKLCQYRRDKFIGRELNFESGVDGVDLIVIDECSMVDHDMAMDLLFFGKRVLVLGDPGQLPPIEGRGYFTDCEPDFMLTEIHRQAKGSPVIELATHVREGNDLVRGQYGDSKVARISSIPIGELLEYDQILCATHNTRCYFNNIIRQLKDYTGSLPVVGEKVVCLKNRHNLCMYNGTIWTVIWIDEEPRYGFIKMVVVEEDTDGPEREVSAPVEGFTRNNGKGGELQGDPFTFGYTLTVHKAQGSKWDSLCIIDDSWRMAAGARKEGKVFNKPCWMYTAITRAAERVTVAC